jgi:hypothetical protein
LATEGRTPGRARVFGSVRVVGVVAGALVLLAVWRSTMGFSFLDDGYYAAATLRLAQGARLFVDEMMLQSLGFLVAVPFVKLWTSLFSTTGLFLALRLFYVALASAAGYATYRVLRSSFGQWPAFAAVAAWLLAPAYNLFAVDYNTMAALGMVLACVGAFAALRDGSRRAALLGGAAAAFASISYPPLALAAITLLVAFWLLGRDRRLVGAALAGAAAVVVPFAIGLATQVTVADLRATADYLLAASRVSGPLASGGRLGAVLGKLGETLLRTWGVPLWAWFAPSFAVSVAAALPALRAPGRARARGWLLTALPVTLALPVLANASVAGLGSWTFAGNYLTAFVLFAAIPMAADLRSMGDQMRRFVLLSLPTGVVGMLVVVSLSSAGLYLASQIVGLAPLAVATVAWWVATVEESAGSGAGRAAMTLLIAGVTVCLFGAAFSQDAPLTLRERIGSGAFAGMLTNEPRVEFLTALEALSARFVLPGDGVLFVASPGAYLALDSGTALTNATWLDHGPADGAAVEYYDRIGRWPDIVFVETTVLEEARASGTEAADPLLFELDRRYRAVETSSGIGFTVLSRR